MTAPRPDRTDELLDEPPSTDHHLGRFAGYRAAASIRKRIVLVMAGAVVLSAVSYYFYVRHLRYQIAHPLAEVEALIEDHETPREMTWNRGHGRLSMRRSPPGVSIIHLPDRDIHLAEGVDRALLEVYVEDGKTVFIEVVKGRVVELGPGGEGPAPAALARKRKK